MSRAASWSSPAGSASHPPDHRRDPETGGDEEHDEPARHVEHRLAVDLAEEGDGQGRRGGERGGIPPTRHPEPDELADGDGDDEGENGHLVHDDELGELTPAGNDAVPEDEDNPQRGPSRPVADPVVRPAPFPAPAPSRAEPAGAAEGGVLQGADELPATS